MVFTGERQFLPLMAADRCMPGAPVAEAVLRRRWPTRVAKLAASGVTAGPGHHPRRRRRRQRRLHPHEARRRRAELGLRLAARAPAGRRHPGRPARGRSPRSTTTRRSTPSSSSTRSPAHLDYDAALLAVDPDKDVDGLHPVNLGRLALGVPGPAAVHAGRHPGAARALRRAGRGPPRGHRRAGAPPSAGRWRCCCR